MTVRRACPHIIAESDGEYYQHFLSQGIDSWLLCGVCSDALSAGNAVDTVPAPGPAVRKILANVVCAGITGTPAITERLGPQLAPVVEARIAGAQISAIGGMPDGTLLAYSESGDLEVLELAADATVKRRILAHLDLEPEKSKPHCWRQISPRLIVDPTGRFAAMVHDYGRTGVVVDLHSGNVTMRLNGGEYHPDAVPFSACFVMHRGVPVLIHRIDWNRLEASNPETGSLITTRAETIHQGGQPRPEHYLDYFHGALLPSPSGSAVLDDGWVWHPMGDLTIFDPKIWLEQNVWETEDGASLETLVVREDWDGGITWITDDLIAFGHIFPEAHKGAGLGFLLRRNPREITPIAGPAGRFFSDGERLFTAAPAGLSVWDLADGARVGFISGFNPTIQHPARRELAEVDGDRLLTWSYSS